jgi:hypothetical protein
VASFVFEPLDIELEGITAGIVLVVAEESLGIEGASENPFAFLAVTLTTIG